MAAILREAKRTRPGRPGWHELIPRPSVLHRSRPESHRVADANSSAHDATSHVRGGVRKHLSRRLLGCVGASIPTIPSLLEGRKCPVIVYSHLAHGAKPGLRHEAQAGRMPEAFRHQAREGSGNSSFCRRAPAKPPPPCSDPWRETASRAEGGCPTSKGIMALMHTPLLACHRGHLGLPRLSIP